jgi:hypothetical protein
MIGLRTARLAALRGLRPLSLPRPAARAYSLPTSSSRPLLRQRLPRPRFNSSHPNPHTAHEAAKEPPKSAYQRFKDLTKTYGSYAVIMYLALSAVDFSLAFGIVHGVGVEPYTHQLVKWYRRIRHGEAGAEALEKADAARKLADEAEAAADEAVGHAWWWNKALWAEVALAYSIHKVGFLPIRAGLTVAWTPKVVNWLRARGWIGTVSRR